jgi:hypothetical protein
LNKLLLLAVFYISQVTAQNSQVTIDGFVRNDSIFLKDIQVINKTTNFVIFSNDKGKFQINVTLGDSILFSSLTHKKRIVKISETHISNKKIIVYLEPAVNELDEVYLQKIKLELKNIAVHQKAVLDNDFITMQKPPNMLATTDPTFVGGGFNALGLISELYKLIFRNKIESRKAKEAKNRRYEKLKSDFSQNFNNKYSREFYTKTLGISEDEVYRFIDFCEGNGLFEYYNKNDFEIKDFLIKQVKKYNEIRN